MRQQMLRDIKILSDAQDVPGLLSFLGAYLVPDREQVGLQEGSRPRSCTPVLLPAVVCQPAGTCACSLSAMII
jgi:hypothetical protein